MIFFQSRLTWQKLRIKKGQVFYFLRDKTGPTKRVFIEKHGVFFWLHLESNKEQWAWKKCQEFSECGNDIGTAWLTMQRKNVEKNKRKQWIQNDGKTREQKKTVDENKHWYNKQWVLYKMTKLSILSTAMLWRHLWINGYCHRSGLGYLCSNLKWDCFTKYWYSWERYESNNSHYG